MSYVDDIQTIARTKEIKELAEKALKTSEAAAKETIKIKRVIADQKGNKGDRAANTGAAAGEEDTAKNAEAEDVDAPKDTPSSPSNTSNTNTTDNPTGTTNNSPINHYANGGAKNNDLSKNGEEKGVGGSDAANLAKGGADDEKWGEMLNAMQELGWDEEQIAAQRRMYLEKEAGVHDIGDVMQGNIGTPPMGVQASQGIIEEPIRGGQILNAVVGLDPNNNNYPVMLRFDNKQVPPTDLDGKGIQWLSEYDAYDTTWQPGYMWTTNGTVWYSSPGEAEAADPDPNAVAVFAGCTPENIEVEGPTAAAACSVTSPYTSDINWPKTGLYLLKMAFGQTTFNIKDTEVPRDKQGNVSSVSIYSKATGATYNVEPGINGGILMYDANSPTYGLYYGSDRTLQQIVPTAQIHLYRPRRQ